MARAPVKGFGDLGDLKKQLKVQTEQDRQAALLKQQQDQAERNNANLFRHHIGAVTPVKAPDKVAPARLPISSNSSLPPTKPITNMADAMLESQNWSDEFENAKGEDDGVSYTAAGSAPDLLNRLRKGQWPVQAYLDLHGKSRDQARTALADFLRKSALARLRCVCIIHGQGFNSAQTAVLPAKVRIWLSQSDMVQAFCPADQRDGGAGASTVLLQSLLRSNPQ